MSVIAPARSRFPSDARMPELALAIDGANVGALLRRHLCRPEHRSVDVQHCKIVRLRYRPENRCVLQYAVTVRDPETSATRRELVTGTLYGDRHRAARRAAGLPGAAFIPELRMVVSVFPSDRKLAQAAILASAEDPVLAAAVLRSFGPGNWRVDSWTTEVVRYREGLSLVLRYVVTASEGTARPPREGTFYAKAYPDQGGARRAFSFLRRLARDSAALGLARRMQAPIACLDHLNCLLFAATAGRPLDAIIETASEAELLAATVRTARALAQFNMSDLRMGRCFSAADYLRSLKRPVAILERACPEVAADVSRVLDRLCSTRAGELCPTHRDMKPEHVLVTPAGLAFIDLDSSASAEPVLDVALMLARLSVLALGGTRRPRISAMAEVVAREYFAMAPQAWRARLPVHYAAALVEVAAGLFHRQAAGWQQNIPRLIATSRQILSDRSDLSPKRIRHLTAAV